MKTIERWMMRRLHGELSVEESRELDRKLATHPELARTFEQLRATWDDIEGPPLARRDDDLTRRVVAAAEAEVRRGSASRLLLPRLAAGAALVLGTWMGLALEPALNRARSSSQTAAVETPAVESSAVESPAAPGLFEIASLDLVVTTDVPAAELGFDDSVFDQLTGEALFAPAPTLAESYWLGTTDPVFGDPPASAGQEDIP